MSENGTKIGEITSANYDPDHNRITYTVETTSGKTGEGTINERMYEPGTALSEDAMRQVAEELPGTPLYDKTHGGVFDPETVPSIGFWELGVLNDD